MSNKDRIVSYLRTAIDEMELAEKMSEPIITPQYTQAAVSQQIKLHANFIAGLCKLGDIELYAEMPRFRYSYTVFG